MIIQTNNLYKKLKIININYKIKISLYKFSQFVLEFIKTRQLEFYFYNNFFNPLHYAIIEKNNGKDENSIKFNNKSEKIVIKLHTTYI